MTDFYIDTAARKRIATKWVVISLFSLHAWATIIVFAVIFSTNNGDILGGMFSTVTFGIGATLAILLLDRASDIILNRFAGHTPSPAAVTETVTRTVSSTPAAEAQINDVTVKVEGNVNVQPSNHKG